MIKKIFVVLLCTNLLLFTSSCSAPKIVPVEERPVIYWKNLDTNQRISIENNLASHGVNIRIVTSDDAFDTSEAHFITLASYNEMSKLPGARFVGVSRSKSCIHIVTEEGTKIQQLSDLGGKEICCGEAKSITAIDATNVLVSERKITGTKINCKHCSLSDQPRKLVVSPNRCQLYE